MKQYGFFVDISRCTGCKTCMMACKDYKDIGPNQNLRRVYEYTGGDWKQEGNTWRPDVFAYYVSISCNHCEDPACIPVCPEKAITKDANGFVVIDAEKCIGCTLCARNCPVDAISGERKQPHLIDQDKCIKCGACSSQCPRSFFNTDVISQYEAINEAIMAALQ